MLYRLSLLLSFGLIGLLISCNSAVGTHSKLLGKWEAVYLVRADRDTTFFQEGTNFPCAYIVVPAEYNSGFEIIDETKGELIWCGEKKGQFFTWSLDGQIMTFQFEDKTSLVSIDNLSDSAMEIVIEETGNRFGMRKY